MTQLNKPIRISIIVENDDVLYLKEKGIHRSSFMRQAIKAHKEGTLKYEYI